MLAQWLPAVPAAQAQPSHPALILHQQRSLQTTAEELLPDHIDAIETLPFDGITIDIDASLTLMQGEPISYAAMYDGALALLKGKFTKLKQNFVMVYIDDPGDVFEDQAWQVTVENWRHLARAVRDAGLTGIMFDNEPYRDGGEWFNYPEDYRDPQHSLQQYQDQTRQRGREIMEAMVAEFPAIELIVLHGPYASEPKTPPAVRRNQAGLASERELNGPFFVGFVEGMGDKARVIDGGEVYQYRTADDFQQSYEWRKHGMASDDTDCAFIPESLRGSWPERVSIAFGQSTEPYNGEAMNPTIMRTTLANALNRADDYVWLYTPSDTWMEPGGLPRAWENAIRDAVAAVRGGEGAAPRKPRRHGHARHRHARRHHRRRHA
jgi:hypothetical protein